MDDTKLPDLTEIRSGNKRSAKLPPQSSPDDTSNWDEKAFIAPTDDNQREMLFHRKAADYIEANPYLEQERVKAKYRDTNKSNKTNQ